MYFIVFGSQMLDRGGICWLANAVGVFECEDAESACQAAAKKAGSVTNFFAVPGTPWGVAMIDDNEVTEYGAGLSEEDKRLAAAVKRQKALLALETANDPEKRKLDRDAQIGALEGELGIS